MRKRITFLPEFTEIADFQDTLARAAFHLAHAHPEELNFLVSPDLLDRARSELTDPSLPDDFDQDVKERLKEISGFVRILDADSSACDRITNLSDVIIVWDRGRFDDSPWMIERSRRTSGVTLFDVDRRTSTNEGTMYAVLAAKLLPSTEGAEYEKVAQMLDSLGTQRDVYLFGSGPSVSEAFDRDFTSGVRIVCNSVILDRELMDHIDPQVLVFADPIFHFGPSSYAAEFRAALRLTLVQRPNLWAVIPSRYKPLMDSLVPELAHRIIGVPFFSSDAPVNLDLRGRFGVKPYPNILTLLMLPLAATVGARVSLLGFDGREPAEDYFWRHGDSVQIHDRLPAIQRVHPGFFAIDYDNYYGAHLATVEYVFRACEAKGIIVEGLGHSFMPPLKSRSNVAEHSEPTWLVPDDIRQHHGALVVSVDPDWIDDFGHYGPWFRSLADECQQQGIRALSLASRGIDDTEPEIVLPTFSYPSVGMLTASTHAARTYAHQFDRELRGAVERILTDAPQTKASLFFYTANVWHLPSIVSLCAQHPTRLSAVVNLMRSHKEFLEAARSTSTTEDTWVTATSHLLTLASEVGVTVTVDTEELARLVEDLCGVRTLVLPMATAAEHSGVARRPETEPLLLYCPALSQEVKGVLEFTHAARSLLAGPMASNVSFRMRSVMQPETTDQRITEEIDVAAEAGVDVLTGTLSNEEYEAAVRKADIIVLPYRTEAFRTKTSGALVDAVLSGKPVVAASGTWAAALLDATGTGVMFRSGDGEDLTRAMLEAVNRYDALKDRAVEAAVQLSDNFAMSRLVMFIIDSSPSVAQATDESIRIRLRDAEALLMARNEGMRHGAESVRPLVNRLQAQQMRLLLAKERLDSRNELLQRAILDRDQRHRGLTSTHKKALDDTTKSLMARVDVRTAQVASLTAQVDERAAQVASLTAQVDERAAQVASLTAQVNRLERDTDVLMQGLANRTFSAIKRRISK